MLARQARAAAGPSTRAAAAAFHAASARHDCCPNHPHHRRRQPRNRPRRAAAVSVVVVAAAASSASSKLIETDASGRVAGAPAAVASYISRVDETWPAWYPRLARATRVGDSDTTFEVVVRAAGSGAGAGAGGAGGLLASFLPTVDLSVQVELLERSPKRVVFQATSSFHEAQEQYALMPCPADPRGPPHTSVRHVSQVRLRGAWAGALAAPVVGGLMAGVPREALERLAVALRAEQQREQQQQQERRQQAGRRRSSSGGGTKGAAEGAPPSPPPSFLAGLFGAAAANSAADPHGLYAALGLEPRDQPAAEAVRAAYRRRAALLHPDANLGAAGADAERLRGEFSRVARAYAVLSDGGARRLYDRGEWRPAEGEEAL